MITARERDGNTRAAAQVSFGDVLKALRKAASLTQEQLAERAGYSTVYVSMLERGQRHPLPLTVAAFVDALSLEGSDRTALERASKPGNDPRGSHEDLPLVGRTREFDLISRHLQGHGTPVLLVGGEPGIGKTRLLREARAHAGMYGLHVLEGGCLRRGGEEPFAPILQALQNHIRARDEDGLRADLAGCEWLVRMLPELLREVNEQLPSWTIPPEQERRLMDEAVIRFVHNVSGPRGTVLVLDDLQWAGTDALDLLRLLATSPTQVRILAAYRENEIGSRHPLRTLLSDLAHGRLVTHVTLGALNDAEAHELLTQLLDGADEVESALREQVLSRADGVPFFVVSCVHALQMSGTVDGNGESIPWDVVQSIQQRVAVLPDAARELLSRAALVGRHVPRWLLVAIGGERDEDLLESLDAACESRLLEEAGSDGYQFTHDVIREVIEANLGIARRTVLHRQIGEALERRGGPVEALAYHFTRSGDDAKATHYLECAGDAAAGQHANATAEGYYRELVDRLDGLGWTVEAAKGREKLGRVLTHVARYDDALSILESAVAVYQQAGDVEGEARAAAEIGRAHYRRGTAEEGIHRLTSIYQQLKERTSSYGLGAVSTALAPLLLAQSRYQEQREAAELAGTVASLLGDDRMLAEAEVWRGCALNQLGDLHAGRDVLEAAIPLAERSGHVTSLVHALNDVGYLYEIGGEFAESKKYKQRALLAAEQVGDPTAIANITFRCGQNAFLSGDWTAAKDYFERSLATARRVDASSILGYPLFGLGLLALAEGNGDNVTSHAYECLQIAEQTGDRQVFRAGESLLAEKEMQEGRPEDARTRLLALEPDENGLHLHSTLPILAEACLQVGDLDTARRSIEVGLQQVSVSRSRVGYIDVLRVKALALIEQERWVEASAVLRDSLESARSMPYPYAVARLLYAKSLVHQRRSEPELARHQLDEALDIFSRLRATWYVAMIERLLSSEKIR